MISQRRLWVAVIWMAIYDAVHGDEAAIRWFRVEEPETEKSYSWICELISFNDKDKLRKIILNKEERTKLLIKIKFNPGIMRLTRQRRTQDD